jgi:ubiquinone/menaquinone biosynthesis C-methylase UbiE
MDINKNQLADKYYVSQEKHHSLGYKEKFGVLVVPCLDDDTIDAWRHRRMYTYIDPLVKFFRRAKWLTVGDGRYGQDAHYLLERGVNVLATDINDDFLKEAHRKKYIKKYKKENAEKLSFGNESFDFVFCKESYHHFPRPMIALYEMLRVAKKAVILIEPNDVKKRGFSWSRFWSVDKLGTQVNRFEKSGNFVYMISSREIEKVALGLGLPAIAFAGIDDHYIKAAGNEKIEDNTFNFRKTKTILRILEIAYRLGIRDRSLLVAIIFKVKPTKRLVRKLENFGYEVMMLPKNPYI